MFGPHGFICGNLTSWKPDHPLPKTTTLGLFDAALLLAVAPAPENDRLATELNRALMSDKLKGEVMEEYWFRCGVNTARFVDDDGGNSGEFPIIHDSISKHLLDFIHTSNGGGFRMFFVSLFEAAHGVEYKLEMHQSE